MTWTFTFLDNIPQPSGVSFKYGNTNTEFEIDEPVNWESASLVAQRDAEDYGVTTNYTSQLKFWGAAYKFITERYKQYGAAMDISVLVSCDCDDTATVTGAYQSRIRTTDLKFEEGVSAVLCTATLELPADIMAFMNRADVTVDLDSPVANDNETLLPAYYGLGAPKFTWSLEEDGFGHYYLAYNYNPNLQDVVDILNNTLNANDYIGELASGGGQFVLFQDGIAAIAAAGTYYDVSNTTGDVNVGTTPGSYTPPGIITDSITGATASFDFAVTTFQIDGNYVNYINNIVFTPSAQWIENQFNEYLEPYTVNAAWTTLSAPAPPSGFTGSIWLGATYSTTSGVLAGLPAFGYLGVGGGMPLTLQPKGINLVDYVTHNVVASSATSPSVMDSGSFGTSGIGVAINHWLWAGTQEPEGGPGALMPSLEGFIQIGPGTATGATAPANFFFSSQVPIPACPYTFTVEVDDVEIDCWQNTPEVNTGCAVDALQNVQISLILDGQTAPENMIKLTFQGSPSGATITLNEYGYGSRTLTGHPFKCITEQTYGYNPSLKLTINNGIITIYCWNGTPDYVSYTFTDFPLRGIYKLQRNLNYTDSFALYWHVEYQDTLSATGGYQIYTFLTSATVSVTVQTLYHGYPATNAGVYMVNETFSQVVESITNGQMKFISDFFGRTDSQPYNTLATTNADGAGSLLCLTNGKKIRNVQQIMDNNSDFIAPQAINVGMPVSWADLFKNLKAIYNLGWNWEPDTYRGDGYFRVRVEPMDYWFNDAVALQLDKIAEVSIDMDYTEMAAAVEVGYSKFQAERYTGLDEFLAKTKYTTQLDTQKGTKDYVSGFIASGYCIEVTRLQQWNSATAQDWRLDNDVFVICLARVAATAPTGGIYNGIPGYYNPETADPTLIYQTPVPNAFHLAPELGANTGADTGCNLIDPPSVYNARISPARNLMRWLPRILTTYATPNFLGNGSPSLVYAAGQGNFLAKTEIANDIYPNGYLWENINMDDNLINSDNPQFSPILQPMTIEFEYPCSMAQFNLLNANANQVIQIRWGARTSFINCWVRKVDYKPVDGMAKWTLAPKWGEGVVE